MAAYKPKADINISSKKLEKKFSNSKEQIKQKKIALLKHMGINIKSYKEYDDTILSTVVIEDVNIFSCGDKKFMILTDEQADLKVELKLHKDLSYIVYTKLEIEFAPYIKENKWLKHNRSIGRGGLLANYDLLEIQYIIRGTCYYLYRVDFNNEDSQ